MQFLSGIRDSRKAGSLWGMMWGVRRVRKSIHPSWLVKGLELGLGLGLLCNGIRFSLMSLPGHPNEYSKSILSPNNKEKTLCIVLVLYNISKSKNIRPRYENVKCTEGIPKYTKLVQVRNFLLPFWVKGFSMLTVFTSSALNSLNQRTAPVAHKVVWPRPGLNLN